MTGGILKVSPRELPGEALKEVVESIPGGIRGEISKVIHVTVLGEDY